MSGSEPNVGRVAPRAHIILLLPSNERGWAEAWFPVLDVRAGAEELTVARREQDPPLAHGGWNEVAFRVESEAELRREAIAACGGDVVFLIGPETTLRPLTRAMTDQRAARGFWERRLRRGSSATPG